MTEEQAKDLFARPLKALSLQGATPNFETLLQAIFAKSEAACARSDFRNMVILDWFPV